MRNFTFGHEKSPEIEFQGLSYHYLYGFYMAFVKGSLSHTEPLLSDAKMLEYITQNLVISNFSSNNFRQVEQTFTQILADKIS